MHATVTFFFSFHVFLSVLCVPRSIDSPERTLTDKEKLKKQSQTLPVTDADMLKAGTSFLDAIERSLGLG